jgi:hypothetical protein
MVLRNDETTWRTQKKSGLTYASKVQIVTDSCVINKFI